MNKIYFALIGMMIITSCGIQNKTEKTDNLNNTITDVKWKLIEINGKPVADKINNKEPFIKFNKNESTYNANAGCNGMGGEFELLGNNRIKLSRGISTMMACTDMEVETKLGSIFPMVDNYTLKGDTLSLNKGRMAPLAKFKAVKVQDELAGTWELDYISGPRIAFEGLYPNRKPTITFNLSEMKAQGNTSCNNFNTMFTLDGNNLKINDQIASTKMACQGEGETVFLNTIKTIDKYSISDNTLTLIMGDIAVMRFKKK